MTSEIRVNKIANRAGLSTVQYTDTGIIVSGIVTCTEISGLNALNIAGVSTFATTLDINGDIDVDGHTNLDNLSVAGVTTFGGSVNYPVGAVANFFDDVNFKGPSGRDIVFDKSHAELHFSDDTTIIMGTNDDLFVTHDGTNPSILTKFGTLDIKTSQVAISTNMTVGGILTATTFKGDGSQLTGIAATTNVRTNSLEVSGVSTFDGNANFTNPVSFGGDSLADVEFKNGNNTRVRFDVTENGLVFLSNSYLYFDQNGTVIYRTGQDTRMWTQDTSKNLSFGTNTEKLEVNNAGVNVAGIVTATSFSGDGSSLSNLPAGAPVGGASTNTVFFENDTAVAVNYQVTSGKNAMSAGPIAINAGIAVTVPSGSSWTIV